MSLIKWPGGKSRLAGKIWELLGEDPSELYCESFFGSGAVYFSGVDRVNVLPGRAILGDANQPLMNMWTVVMGEPERLEESLRILDGNDKPFDPPTRASLYQSRRDIWNNGAKSSALLLWLNHCCFNGLWRENRRGEMNTPVGSCSWNIDTVCKEIHRHASMLGNPGATSMWPSSPILRSNSFYGTVDLALAMSRREHKGKRCRFYFDPPYHYGKGTGFTSYLGDRGFTVSHADLAALGRELASEGHRVVVSGADNDATREVYKGWRAISVGAQNTIGCDGTARGTRRELLMWPPAE